MSTRNLSRKEERIEASIDYQMSTNPMALGGAAFDDMIRKMNVNHSFVAGAEWADKTMLDKVCEWVKKHYIEYAHNRLGQEYIIDDLREAMKGE